MKAPTTPIQRARHLTCFITHMPWYGHFGVLSEVYSSWTFTSIMSKKHQKIQNRMRPRQIPAESTHKGVNYPSKDVTQTQQQRPKSPTVPLTWHARQYKVHKLHQRHILKKMSIWWSYVPCIWGCNWWKMSWCLMSSDVIWHIRDKLWPMPKHGSIKATYVRCMRV